jgi:hypothetical protein
MTLRDQWLAAMRASTTRAIGRECDYAMSEGDVDKFDPLGLLALLEAQTRPGQPGGDHLWFKSYPGEDGGCVSHNDADYLGFLVGLGQEQWFTLALLNDAGASWAEMADWVERRT